MDVITDFEKDAFLEDEVKDGFYIPSIMKRAWKQSLKLLKELDRVCTKYGLHYYLEYGTLLGAVRHGGIIPWDDDLDVCMHRNDVEKLKEIASKEFPEGYTILNFENSDNWKFIESLTNTERMNFSPEYLKEHDGFPYIAGIDIFVLDNVTADKEFETKRAEDINQLLLLGDLFQDEGMNLNELRATQQYIQEKTGLDVRGLDEPETKRTLYREARRIMMLKNDKETEHVVQMVPWGVKFSRYTPRTVYKNPVRIPFMGMNVMVPACFDELLTKRYGLYAKIVQVWDWHEYPYFDGQAEQLGVKVDYPVKYKFKPEVLKHGCADRSNSLKTITSAVLEELEEFYLEICNSERQNQLEILEQCQMLAIDLGTLVEQVKGEGTKAVWALETYCEMLYQISAGNIRIEELKGTLDRIKSEAEAEIINRREVLFIPYKSEHWGALEEIWKEKCKEPNTDVYVVTVPYFYKEYDGRMKNMVYEPEKYPKELNIIEYKNYAIELHCPDEVYIQNPYDEYNMAVSMHPDFYASKIRAYTDHLVYIPYFKTSDFEKTNRPQMYGMQYYCTVPGVVLADRVIVHSEVIRERYIEVLTEFAGVHTKEIWEEKIIVAEHRPNIAVGQKRKLVFSNSLGTLLKFGQRYFEYLNHRFEILREASAEIDIIWYIEPWMEQALKEYDGNLFAEWEKLRREVEKAGWCIVDDNSITAELADRADAYYGDTTVCLKDFELRGKPVMVANPEIY